MGRPSGRARRARQTLRPTAPADTGTARARRARRHPHTQERQQPAQSRHRPCPSPRRPCTRGRCGSGSAPAASGRGTASSTGARTAAQRGRGRRGAGRVSAAAGRGRTDGTRRCPRGPTRPAPQQGQHAAGPAPNRPSPHRDHRLRGQVVADVAAEHHGLVVLQPRRLGCRQDASGGARYFGCGRSGGGGRQAPGGLAAGIRGPHCSLQRASVVGDMRRHGISWAASAVPGRGPAPGRGQVRRRGCRRPPPAFTPGPGGAPNPPCAPPSPLAAALRSSKAAAAACFCSGSGCASSGAAASWGRSAACCWSGPARGGNCSTAALMSAPHGGLGPAGQLLGGCCRPGARSSGSGGRQDALKGAQRSGALRGGPLGFGSLGVVRGCVGCCLGRVRERLRCPGRDGERRTCANVSLC